LDSAAVMAVRDIRNQIERKKPYRAQKAFLEKLLRFIDPKDHYANYRAVLGQVPKYCIPWLGK
jgi:hypothetical protein